MRTLTIFEEKKTKTVKKYSDDIEVGVAKREKLEQEGINVFGCDKCQQQFSQQDKETGNYLIDYFVSFLAINPIDPTSVPRDDFLVREIKHRTCPGKNIGLERPGSFRREGARMKSKHE
jgi:hypothetical protein